MSLVTYTCGTCGAERRLKFRAGKVDLSKDCHTCAGKKTKVAEWSMSHGGHKTRLYQVWCQMKQRCSWPKSNAWVYYGGKGITVCEEWKESFAAFRNWALAAGYAYGLIIDRFDNSKGYFPENCHWATHAESGQNTSHTKLTVADVCVIRDLARIGVGSKLLAALYRVDISTVSNIKGRYSWKSAEAQLWAMEEALA